MISEEIKKKYELWEDEYQGQGFGTSRRMYTLCILSDVQEALLRGHVETAMEWTNKAKYHLIQDGREERQKTQEIVVSEEEEEKLVESILVEDEPSPQKEVRMRCSVCGANIYMDGTQDCECDEYDYSRQHSPGDHTESEKPKSQLRRLELWEIEKLASRKGVKRIAVENFLMTVTACPDAMSAYANMEMDTRLYKWSSATQGAISKGIEWAQSSKPVARKPKV